MVLIYTESINWGGAGAHSAIAFYSRMRGMRK